MMKKALVSFFTIVTVTCSLSVTSFADTPNNKSLNDDKVQYNQISGEIKNLDSNIRDLNNQIDSLNSTISTNKDKVKQIEKNIDSANVQIADTQKQINEGQEVLSNRLAAIYKSGAYSPAAYLVYILQSDGFGQLISRMYDVQRIVSIDDQLINTLKDNRTKIQTEVDNLNKQKSEVITLNDQTQKSLDSLVTKQNTVKAEKAKLDTQLQSVASVITANEEQLINYSLNVINNSNSSISALKNAISTLNGLLPQLTMQSVKDQANNAISKANNLISQKEAAEKAPTPPPTTGGGSTSGSGSWNGQYLKEYSMEATAYAGDGVTATGTATVRNPNGISTVAVDPNVIPLGSKLYIPGYGFAVAADTGGAIKGNRIDLFMNSNAECNAFGRRQIVVYVVANPGQW
ncbi:MAG: 3D domain-containing protein [Clostridium sp.]|uniref:3D domain-containing protein n=1 Tax=Clostridium sp. TaxID=1506 RepID=UPI003F2B6DE2